MIEFDEKEWQCRWVQEYGPADHYMNSAVKLAREAHDRAVRGMSEDNKQAHMSPFEKAHRYEARPGESGCQPADLHCKAQPRTLFEDAALAALQGMVVRGDDWPNVDGAMEIAAAFCAAVREAQS